MGLLAHITMRDLLDLHNDIMDATWPGTYWQRGTSGVLAGTSLPGTFSSTEATLQLQNWVDDPDELNEKHTVPLINERADRPTPVLNIPTKGFFRVSAVTSNSECSITYLSGAYLRVVNRWLGASTLTNTDITAGTGLEWSLGGWEEKIANAYRCLLNDLSMRGLLGWTLDDDDPTYTQALTAKALQLIFIALSRDVDDYYLGLAREYGHQYDRQLQSVKPYCDENVAAATWERC